MRLEYLYVPVPKLADALPFYRDTLGWDESWREGDSTVAFKLPSDHVQVMVDQTEGYRPGPMFIVDDVRAFNSARSVELNFTVQPEEIPGGYLAAFDDPAGNCIYIVDQSADNASEPA